MQLKGFVPMQRRNPLSQKNSAPEIPGDFVFFYGRRHNSRVK
jgi:hypothetical protein